MDDELLTAELPSPPQGEQVQFDDSFDASLLADVPNLGECMPVGTYVFRLDSYTSKTRKGDPEAKEEHKRLEQPYYELHWKCQQEPYVGRVVYENCPWVKQEDVKDASSQDSPRRSIARKIINDRMPRAKEIMAAAGFNPTGKFGFLDFLGQNPELKLQLKVKEKQAKGLDGTWKGTGIPVNEVQKHVSLHRPA